MTQHIRRTRQDFCNKGHSLIDAYEKNGRLQCKPCTKELVQKSRAGLSKPRTDALTRLNEKVIFPENPDDCYGWTGYVHPSGAGQFQMKVDEENRSISIARARWILEKGPIPLKMDVCHTCDNPLCSNLRHLWVGTPKQNSEDMARKGRARGARGEKNWTTKLDEEKVLEILKLHNEKVSNKDLAVRFGVAKTTISSIVTGKNWQWLHNKF